MFSPLKAATKTRLTINFMKKKIEEYDDLKKEIDIEKK